MNTIDLNLPVAEIINQHPEVKDILVELGFSPLANPAMLHTVGKVTSLKMGSKMTKISLKQIQQTLEWNGYQVVGGNDE
ncbi:TPA: DUF1858 domain-containing protein [Streptococcus suis]|nr:DUF1858 domain-containing protein [Streptococcus suis]